MFRSIDSSLWMGCLVVVLVLVIITFGTLLVCFLCGTLIKVIAARVGLVVSAFVVWLVLRGLGVGRVCAKATSIFREVFTSLPRYFVATLPILAVYAAFFFAPLPLPAPHFSMWLEAVCFLVYVVGFTWVFMLIVWMFDTIAQAMGVTASVHLVGRRFVVHVVRHAIINSVLYGFVLRGAPVIGILAYAKHLVVMSIVLTAAMFVIAAVLAQRVGRLLGRRGAAVAVALFMVVVTVVLLLAEIHLLITYMPPNLLTHLKDLLLSLLTAVPSTVRFVRNVLTKRPQ